MKTLEETPITDKHQPTSEEAVVKHDEHFFFTYKETEYRAIWYTVGYSYAGLRVEKKCTRLTRFFIKRFVTLWDTTYGNVLADIKTRSIRVQNKKEYYNARKSVELCFSALDEIKDHTETVVL